MAITTLLFDLDDTLIDDTRAVELALTVAADLVQERHGIEQIAFMQTARAIAGEMWRASPTFDCAHNLGISPWEGLCTTYLGLDSGSQALQNWSATYRTQVWTESLRPYGIDDHLLARELDQTYQRERLTHQQLFPEVADVLGRLATRYRLGLITNGASDLQRRKIQRAQLARFFAVMVVSEEVGVGKPHPQIFLQTLRTLEAEPSSAIMLGDNLSRDILGARNSGIQGVWMNRAHKIAANEGAITPDAEVSTLLLLESML